MKVFLANPRGFCAGVARAIDIVEAALQKFGAPIYVRHEVVHNRFVVDDLKKRGAIFVDELTAVPDDSVVIFSAHGVSQAVRQEARDRNLTTVLDATCPLVTKVHLEVARLSKQGIECILIGHAGHAEVEGTLGQYHNPLGGIYLIEKKEDIAALSVKNPESLFYVTQTTLSVDETIEIIETLKLKFPMIQGPKRDDICYATQNRQDAVRKLAQVSDIIFVVGSVNSSNSNRLRELAEQNGCSAYLVDNVSEIQSAWLENKKAIGVTAGASAPEILVREILQYFKDQWQVTTIEEITGEPETMVFALPKEIRNVKVTVSESMR